MLRKFPTHPSPLQGGDSALFKKQSCPLLGGDEGVGKIYFLWLNPFIIIKS
jgi:hypothetical protein